MAETGLNQATSKLSETKSTRATPLPWKQLSVVLYVRLCDPFAYTAIFPFVNQLCTFLLPNVEKQNIGSYSGLLEAVYAGCQASTMFFWGSLSDRIGRKPVMLVGLSGMTLGLCALGSARSFAFALFARAACGILAGNSTALRAVLGEITDETNQGRAYPLFSICFELSMVLAPAMGGVLSNPAEQYPNSIFAKIALFKALPFLLPCAAVAALCLSAFFVCLLLFEETLESKRKRPQLRRRLSSFTDDRRPMLKPDHISEEAVEEGRISMRQMLKVAKIRHCLTAFFLNTFVSLGFDSVFVLFAYSSPQLGGLNLSSASIAACLSFRGVISIIFALTCFAPLHKRYGTKRLYHIYVAAWMIAYALPMLMNYLLVNGGEDWQAPPGKLSTPMMVLMALCMVFYSLGDNQFPLIMMALNESAPSKNVLGAVNGLGMSFSAAARAMGPLITNSAYSASLRYNVPFAVWILLMAISFLAWLQTFQVFPRRQPENYEAVDLAET